MSPLRCSTALAIFVALGLAPLTVSAQPMPAAGFRGQGATQLVLDPQGYRSPVTGIAISPDDRLVAAAGEKEVRIWSTQTGELLHTLRGDRLQTPYGNAYSVTFSPNGRELVVGIDDYSEAGSIRVYDTSDFSEIKELVGGMGIPVRHVQFSRDGRWLAAAGENGKIFLFDWAARKRVATIEPEQADQPIYDALMFPSSAPVLFVIGFKGPAFYSVPQGRKMGFDEFPEALQWIQSLRGIQYPAGSNGRIPQLWNLPFAHKKWMAASTATVNGAPEYWVSVWDAGRMQPAAVYRKHPWNVMQMTLSSSGRLAASTDKMGEIHVWDPRSGTQLQRFRSLGHQFYDSALSNGGNEMYFATKNFPGREFRQNHYGPIDTLFNIHKRLMTSINPPGSVNVSQEQLNAGTFAINLIQENNVDWVVSSRNGQRMNRYRVRSGRRPLCLTALSRQELGIPFAAIWGDEVGSVECWNAQTEELRRVFVGHEGFVSSVGSTPDGKLLITSSTDRTIRIWSLKDYKPTGKFDFDYQSDSVIEVRPNTSSARAGVHVGDRVISLDGKTITEIENLLLMGKFDYKPGQQITAVMERNNQRYNFQMTLIEGPDYVEPLLSGFVTKEGEWILWTAEGYYDSSPGAERFIGWHVNRGPSKSAEFYGVGQFKNLYRPDIIDKVFETGDTNVAILKSNERNPNIDHGEHIDLRDKTQLDQVKPPKVKILSPAMGATLNDGNVTVKVRVETENNLPVEQVTILVNGRPAEVIEPKAAGPLDVENQRPIQLPAGINEISVIAYNGKAKSDARRVDVNVKLPAGTQQASDARLYVLAIGVSEFQNDGNGINNLDFAANDATAFSKMMSRNAGLKLFKDVECNVITNKDATRAGILKGFNWLRQKVRPIDIAVIFISSHGLRDEVTEDFYLAGHDVDIQNIVATGVSWKEITDYLHKRLGYCKRIMFIDTCHAGGVAGANGTFVRDPLRDLTVEEVGAIVFASSAPRELSQELSQFKHGAFTQAVLSIVDDKKADIIPAPSGDGLFNAAELEVQLVDRVAALTKDQQHPVVQKPLTLTAFPFMHLLSKE